MQNICQKNFINIELFLILFKALLLMQWTICSFILLNCWLIILSFKFDLSWLIDPQLKWVDYQFFFCSNMANWAFYICFNTYNRIFFFLIYNKTYWYSIVTFFIAVCIYQFIAIFIPKKCCKIISVCFFLQVNIKNAKINMF